MIRCILSGMDSMGKPISKVGDFFIVKTTSYYIAGNQKKKVITSDTSTIEQLQLISSLKMFSHALLYKH